MYDDVLSPELIDDGPNSWKFRSPSRLLLGAAVTLGQRVIISADYERSWYQQTRLRHSPIMGLDYTDITREVFKGSNTLRVGAEAWLAPFLAVRAGYIWSGATLRNDYADILASHPMPTMQRYITAGLGFQLNETTSLDLAYQYGTTTYTRHQTFYLIDPIDEANDIYSRVFQNETSRHIAVVTLSFLF
jgi:long-subunit fatty acid transport protein